MANKTIPQQSPECKGISEIITELEKQTNRIGYLMGASALKHGTPKAIEVFHKFGADIFIDDAPKCKVWISKPSYREIEVSLSGFTTVFALAHFLGVNPQYVRGVMNRYGFTSKRVPDDVYIANVWRCFGDHSSNRTAYRIVYGSGDSSSEKAVSNKNRKQTIMIRGARYTNRDNVTCQFISGRVALCICLIMVYGQKIPMGSKPLEILKDLEEGSVYASDARALLIRLGILKDDKAEQPATSPATGISADELIKILKAFSGEIAAAISVEIAKVFSNGVRGDAAGVKPSKKAVNKPAKPTASMRYKMKDNPENWPDIIRQYEDGASMTEIGEQLGWDRHTVRDHLRRSGIRIESNRRYQKKMPDNWPYLVHMYRTGELTKADLASALGWHYNTVAKYLDATPALDSDNLPYGAPRSA